MVKKFILIFYIIFSFSNIFCYYSVKLNKVYLPVKSKKSKNITRNNLTFHQNNNSLDEFTELPLNNSDLNEVNETYIPTHNFNFETYSASLYIGSNMQHFRLILSTKDDYTTISSVDCTICNVTNKYNSSLSTTNMNKTETFFYPLYEYSFIHDSCLIPSQKINNGITENNLIKISKLKLKIMENDFTGFIDSYSSDGILGLNYADGTELPNSNFIRELYNEGIISSPSFSLIITSSNINRLYLGDIMENENVRQFINDNMDLGECTIPNNEKKWKCQFSKLEFNAIKYLDWQNHISYNHLELTFDMKDNKLTIPESYFNLIVVGYVKRKRKIGKTTYYVKEYNKSCRMTIDGTILCDCTDKDDFGILSFHFNNNSRLDIDIRDYVHYDDSSIYKCRVDISLSKDDEFIVGLKGFNNTILSFNMEEKKIKFFYKKKYSNSNFYIYCFVTIILIILGILLK